MATRDTYEIQQISSLRELYHFYIGDGSWFDYKYTNRDSDYIDIHTAGNPVYKASNIKRNKIRQTTAQISNTIELTTSRHNPVAQAFKPLPPHGGINIDMAVAYDEDLGSITDPDNLTFWRGKVIDVKFEGNIAVLICDSKFKVLDRLALRRRATRRCPYPLYSDECTVPKSYAGRTGVVTSISDAVTCVLEESPGPSVLFTGPITSLWEPTTFYSGGYAKYTDPSSNYESKVGIKSYTIGALVSGSTYSITMTFEVPITNLLAGSSLTLYPGCPRTPKGCYHRFSNYLNYGGIFYLTVDEPFSTSFRTPLN